MLCHSVEYPWKHMLLFSEKRRCHGPLPVKKWRPAQESISARP
jgi:hypothetical protein